MQTSNYIFLIIHIPIKMSSSRIRKKRKYVRKAKISNDQLLEPSNTVEHLLESSNMDVQISELSSAKDKIPRESIAREYLLKDVIQKVRNMAWTPPVYVYTIKAGRNSGLSAVDLNQNHSLLACTFPESSDIFIKEHIVKSLRGVPDVDLLSEYNTFRFTKQIFENKLAHNSSYGPYTYLLGHTLPVTGLKFAPQGFLMSCSLDGTVRAWNMKNLRQEELYSGCQDFFEDIDISCDSSYFATASTNGPVCQFSFERSFPLQRFVGHSADVKCVRIHPNGIYIASASDDKTIKLWSTQTASVARNFQDDAIPRALAFCPNGKFLAAYSGGAIKIWDLASGQLLKKLNDSSTESTFHKLCFSEFGGVLASGGVQKELKLWNVANFRTESQEAPHGSTDAKPCLLKCYSLPRKIQFLKFDQNNFFTCVTA